MVSWGDGEESSADASTDSEGPTTMYDSDYTGLANDGGNAICCKCNAVAIKNVAFEGCWTGRRFLTCAGQFGEYCDFLHWVDDVWPDSLCKCLSKLWEMYSEMKDGRVNAALNHVKAKYKYQDEISKLKSDLRNAQDELKLVVEEKQLTLALKAKAEQAMFEANAELEQKKTLDACTTNMHRSLRVKAEKDRDQLKEEKMKAGKERDQFKQDKRKLEFIIADLFKQKEVTRAKLRKIKAICDE